MLTTVKRIDKTKAMTAGAFRARCLAVLDEVEAKRITVVITKRGLPVAKLVPIATKPDSIFGFMKGKVKIKGDILKPALTLREWGNLA